MKKELADSLRHMQANPTTGTPHNQQLISTQVETIFMLDELKEQIEKLNNTIALSEKQSQRLEESNYKLQKVMLLFTAITTTIAAFPVLLIVFNYISPIITSLLNISAIPIAIVGVISALVSLIVGFITFRYQLKFSDTIKIRDSIDMVVRDKDGKVKETRHNE